MLRAQLELRPPRGRFVNIFQAYADASGVNGPVLTVANFLFENDNADKFHSEWSKLLDPVLANEPPHKRYFHMNEFFLLVGPYKKLGWEGSHKLQKKLIAVAHDTIEYGVVASVLLRDYESTVRDDAKQVMGGPFTMLNIWCMEVLSQHLDKAGKPGSIKYCFEDGDAGKDELDLTLGRIGASRYLNRKYRFHERAFMPKQNHHALAVSDMLAWEYRNGIERHLADPESWKRPCLHVLFEKPLGARHFSRTNLQFREMGQMIERANRWAAERQELAEEAAQIEQ